ncbi:hypothetical protein C8R44DRAFT_941197 [Mycena epipterygia]|nr:hypothetical protein C8R44DRAFT_941197 [Mycena epipterygia]
MFKWFIALCHMFDPPGMCAACSLLAVLLRQSTALAALGEPGVGRGRFCGFEVARPRWIAMGSGVSVQLNDPRASFSNGSNRQFLGDALVFNSSSPTAHDMHPDVDTRLLTLLFCYIAAIAVELPVYLILCTSRRTLA